MKRMDRLFLRHLFLLLAALIAPALQAADEAVTNSMVGHWEGSARIIVDWCKQQRLPVAIDIHADGTVTGKVGDAVLAHGRFGPNRGWIGRKLNLATDYIVRGDLTGPIVAAEGITRTGVSIPLDLANGSLDGGVHTSGSKIGGREGMILSASSLRLTRRT